MKYWIGSDFHWGHQNIMKFCPETRAHFRDVADMDESMIRDWNSKVNPEDTVFMLGDIAFYNAEKSAAILQRLNGNKILVEGNHDRKNLKSSVFRDCFTEVHQILRYVHKGQLVIMCHYPFHYEWDQAHRGSVHFHGHVHGKQTGLEEYRARDVGMDATGKVVSSLDEMIADAVKGKIATH